MKKISFFIACILSFSSLMAKVDPPTNVIFRKVVNSMLPTFVTLEWDFDETGMIDHYEVFLNGVEFPNRFSDYAIYITEYGLPEPLTMNEYYDFGVSAVDINGISSDTVNFHIYISDSSYSCPENLTVVNNLDAGTALFTWSKPPHGNGEGEPTPIAYSVFLDGNFITETNELQYTFTGLQVGTNYVAGLITRYSDGHYDTTIFHNNSKVEFYFDNLPGSINSSVDETSGKLSWSKPNCEGDVIGGTFTCYPAGLMWPMVWFNPDELYTSFGDSNRNVRTSWIIGSWDHNSLFLGDTETINFYTSYNFQYSIAEVRNIFEIINAANMNYTSANHYVHSPRTNGGIGSYLVDHDEETGYYGVIRLDDMYNYVYEEMKVSFNITWWLQTNGSDDFSNAYNYYPKNYNIYLDGEFIETYTPGYEEQYISDYEYQFEGLVGGQTYTAGIEAVYNIGKSKMVTIEFTPTVGIEENRKASPSLNIYPNPITSQASISYAVYEAGPVTIEIFDVMGKKVKILLDDNLTPGEYQISWDCKNDKGLKLLPGMYLCTLRSAQHASTRRILVN